MTTLINMIRNRYAPAQADKDARPKRAVTRDELQRLFRKELGMQAV